MEDDFMMDTGGGDLIFVDDLTDGGGGEPEIDQGGEPQAQPEPQAAAPDEIALLRAEVDNLKTRLHDTQGSFHRADQGRQLYEAMVQANRDAWADRQRAEQAAQAMAPPQFSPEEIEELHTDPNAIPAAMVKIAEWSRQRTLAEVGPYIARLNTAVSTVEPIAVREVHRAEADAREIARQGYGIDNDEFTRLAPAVDQMLISAAKGDPAAYQRSRLDPRVIAVAMSAARVQFGGGVPVQQSPIAPSIGGGGRGGGVARLPQRLNHVASDMERRLGLASGEITAAPVRNRANGRL